MSEKSKLVPGTIRRELDEETEHSFVAEFLTCFGNYTSVRPATAFEFHGLMQHYGLPTRLLDWSLSPLNTASEKGSSRLPGSN